MALTSMTGFADLAGGPEGPARVWEARSVNGRGLDLRLRLPEGFEGAEPAIRAAAGRALARGSVSVTLKLVQTAPAGAPRLSPEGLGAAIEAALAASAAASARGLDLAPMTAAGLLGLRGVYEVEARPAAEASELAETLAAEAEALFARLAAARREEGAALAALIGAQVDGIEALAVAARAAAAARGPRLAEALRTRLEAALAAAQGAVEEGRLAQELALIAVRADVTEELDRLDAHVAAARALIAGEAPAGRRLDFLTQEFNREANTLCSKAQSAELTAIGLEMKVLVDRMREQVQNVE